MAHGKVKPMKITIEDIIGPVEEIPPEAVSAAEITEQLRDAGRPLTRCSVERIMKTKVESGEFKRAYVVRGGNRCGVYWKV